MMDRLRSWLPLLPLLLLMGATYWLNLQVQSPTEGPNNDLLHDPDYVVDNFTATTLDIHGKVNFVMSAKKMWHYPDDDVTLLEAPKLESLSHEQSPLHISAQKGEISSKGDEVILRNDVVIVRPAYAKQSELTFKTEYLRVTPAKDIADTDKAVTLYDSHATLNAVGMELDNKLRSVKFLSNVKTEYEPPKK